MTLEPRSNHIDRAAEDDRVYSAVYHALVAGMTASTVLFALGVGLALLRAKSGPAVMDLSHAYDLRNLIPGLLALDPIAIMVLGTIIMILTPVSRVVVSLFAFIRERDHAFTAMTLFVLLSLAVTLFLGLTGRLE